MNDDADTPAHRRHTAVLALWRLRTPLLMLGLDEAWDLHRTTVEHAFNALLLAPGTEATAAPAPFPPHLPEGEPDGILAEFQLEVLAELTAWPTTPHPDPDPEHTKRIVHLARDLSRSLDLTVEDCLWDHPARHAHARYLATLPEGAPTGYHQARNLAVEGACHDLATALPPDPTALPATAAGREALALSEAFGVELTATLAWLKSLGR
ncbi:hypothetical protein [Streptomyces sp. NPDC096033]|uniref:hypothetical protein n=1 Tax=Streptomyces sp. NPDC096033 TaxID=3366071 RepID=UPI0038065CDB